MWKLALIYLLVLAGYPLQADNNAPSKPPTHTAPQRGPIDPVDDEEDDEETDGDVIIMEDDVDREEG